MRWHWLRKKARRDRSKDWNRHHRVAQRLLLRMNEAHACGNFERVKVLAARIHHVRDIQIADVGF